MEFAKNMPSVIKNKSASPDGRLGLDNREAYGFSVSNGLPGV